MVTFSRYNYLDKIPKKKDPVFLVTNYSCLAFQLFFIDHSSKTTSFMDPRLPIDAPFVNATKLAVPSAHHRRSRSSGEEEASRVSVTMSIDEAGLGEFRVFSSP